MGVEYYPFVPGDELKEVVEGMGLSYTWNGVSSRWPSIREIESVLNAMHNCDVTYGVDGGVWRAFVVDNSVKGGLSYTDLRSSGYDGDVGRESPFYLVKGDDFLNLQILKRLTLICGTLILIDTDTATPIEINWDTDINAFLSSSR